MATDTIRRATDADLEAVHQWLAQEDVKGVKENFLCNWEVIEESHQNSRLTVFVDGATEVPVAFQLGGLIHPGILEVRSDMRRKGIGRRLVDYCVAEAVNNDECFLLIEYNPPSSIPYWQTMGFTLFGDQRVKKRAYRVLGKKLQLPPGGQRVVATIQFYPEDRKWKGGEAIRPFDAPKPTAEVMPDGVVYLSERVFFCKPIHPEAEDVVIAIIVGGECRYLDKAKYSEAKSIGVSEIQSWLLYRPCSSGCCPRKN